MALRTARLAGALDSITPIHTAMVFTLCLIFLVSFIPLQQNADGLLLTLASLQKLTVYYWGQDRLGLLTPLLTVWVRDPIVNAYGQLVLRLLAGLIAPLFFCGLVLRRPADAWRATVLSDCLMLICAGAQVFQETFVEANPYSMSLACAGLATTALRGSSRCLRARLLHVAAVCLLVVAYIVNLGLIIIALPLVGMVSMLLPSAHTGRLLVLHIAAAAIGFLLPPIFSPEYTTPFGMTFVTDNLIHYADVIWAVTGWRFLLAALLPSILLVLASRWRLHNSRLVVLLLATQFGAAVLSFTATALSRWLVINAFHIRYFVPGLILLLSVGGISLWLTTKTVTRDSTVRNGIFFCLTLLLLLGAYQRLQVHRIDNSDIVGNGRSELARAVAVRYLVHALDGIAGGGIADGYWNVWPAVFMTEQYHHDNGYKGPNVFGITYRGRVRRSEFIARLAAQGRIRLACIDLSPTECAARASSEMGTPELLSSEFAPSEPLPNDHRLEFVEIRMAAGQ
jgi:hypothetical protein